MTDDEKTQLMIAGAALERDRTRAIFELPEAKGHERAALTLATTTSLTPEACANLLASFPKAEPFDGRDPRIGLALDYVDGPMSPAQVAAQTNAGPVR